MSLKAFVSLQTTALFGFYSCFPGILNGKVPNKYRLTVFLQEVRPITGAELLGFFNANISSLLEDVAKLKQAGGNNTPTLHLYFAALDQRTPTNTKLYPVGGYFKTWALG